MMVQHYTDQNTVTFLQISVTSLSH